MNDGLDDNLVDWAELKGQADWSGLLIGNGFSQNLWRGFGYTSLFETASQGEGAHLNAADVSLFERLETRNFELVLSALATSKTVCAALDQPQEPFSEREVSIREALIRAVHSVHIPWQSVPDAHLDTIAAELATYASIYCTNYDLTVYWALMRTRMPSGTISGRKSSTSPTSRFGASDRSSISFTVACTFTVDLTGKH